MGTQNGRRRRVTRSPYVLRSWGSSRTKDLVLGVGSSPVNIETVGTTVDQDSFGSTNHVSPAVPDVVGFLYCTVGGRGALCVCVQVWSVGTRTAEGPRVVGEGHRHQPNTAGSVRLAQFPSGLGPRPILFRVSSVPYQSGDFDGDPQELEDLTQAPFGTSPLLLFLCRETRSWATSTLQTPRHTWVSGKTKRGSRRHPTSHMAASPNSSTDAGERWSRPETPPPRLSLPLTEDKPRTSVCRPTGWESQGSGERGDD